MTTDEEIISRLYKQGKEPGPAAHIDNTILSAARDAVQDDAIQDRQKAKKPATARSLLLASPFSGGWRAPASIAAVLIITVILVPLLQQEEMSPGVSPVADEPSILKKEQDLIKASDARKPGAIKASRQVNVTAKKRTKMEVLEAEQASQLYSAPEKAVNTDSFNRGKQLAAEEKIAAVKTLPVTLEQSLSAVQKPQPASALPGASVLHDQKQNARKLKVSAEIKQQSMQVLDAEESTSVTMAAKPWLQKIRQLIAQGDLDLAQKELDEFKLHYPDENIDSLIVNQLKFKKQEN
jgi:hypothetical protein